ncbi:hypothetical protein WJX72_002157 [[Myrmecia] bisecta]|uniref:Uncharacterized protein n=1 Tax=[Myrmecia] bisecta TaxID=41462 RepID=A0AAW1PC99_9CHLO
MSSLSGTRAAHLRYAYVANVAVCTVVGLVTLLSPALANELIFLHKFALSEAFRVVGAMWLTVAILSAMALRAADARTYAPVLLSQLTYKSIWMAVAVSRAIQQRSWTDFPFFLAAVFVPYLVIWPCIIPWSYLGGGKVSGNGKRKPS